MNKKILLLSALFSAGLLATGIDESNPLTKLDGADKPHLSESSTDNTLLDCEWLYCDGKKYLAVAGVGGDDGSGTSRHIRIFEFDPFQETLTKALLSDVTHDVNNGQLNALSWLVCGDKKYLAVGGTESDDGDGGDVSLRVYRFNPNTQELTKVDGNEAHNGTIQALDWLVCEDTKYLAIGGNTVASINVRLLTFNDTTEDLTEDMNGQFNHEDIINSVSWCVTGTRKLLAIGGDSGGDGSHIRVLELNTVNNMFTVLSGANKVHGGTVQSVDWLSCGNKKYLAIGGATGTDSTNIRVYEFDAIANTLTEIEAARTLHGSTVFEVKWLNCGGDKYLAIIGSNAEAPKDVALRMYKFDQDAGTLTQIFEFTHGDSAADDLSGSLAWLQCGGLAYLAVVGEQSPVEFGNVATRVFRVNFDQDATNKLLREKFFQLHDNNAPEASQKA